MVPFVAAIVPEVDVEAGTLTVTPPAGLFEELVDETAAASDGDATEGDAGDELRGIRHRATIATSRGVVRVDIVTIFPSFFAVLDLSLLGKARQSGLIEVHRARPARLHPRPAPHRR